MVRGRSWPQYFTLHLAGQGYTLGEVGSIATSELLPTIHTPLSIDVLSRFLNVLEVVMKHNLFSAVLVVSRLYRHFMCHLIAMQKMSKTADFSSKNIFTSFMALVEGFCNGHQSHDESSQMESLLNSWNMKLSCSTRRWKLLVHIHSIQSDTKNSKW